MAAPIAAAATIAKKIPRGVRIRTARELKDAEGREEEQPKIPLPAFLFLLFIAAAADLLDLVELIPIIGTLIAFVFGMILGAILWVTYFALGARSTAALVAMAGGALTEFIPGLSILPLNVITAVSVYLLMNPQIIERVVGAAAGIGGRTRSVQKIGRVVETGIKVAQALPPAAA